MFQCKQSRIYNIFHILCNINSKVKLNYYKKYSKIIYQKITLQELDVYSMIVERMLEICIGFSMGKYIYYKT